VPFRTEGRLQADIGIVVNANPRRSTMQTTNRTRSILASLFIVLVAAALIGATVWTPARETASVKPAVNVEVPPKVGTFTGEFDRGVPVYRLPSVNIVTTRRAERARMAQGEQLARQ
jgi:hypothetical protein